MIKNNLLFTVSLIAWIQLSCTPSHDIKPASQEFNHSTFLFPNTRILEGVTRNTSALPKNVFVKNITLYFVPAYGYVYFNEEIISSAGLKHTDIVIHETAKGKVVSPVRLDEKKQYWMYQPDDVIKSIVWRPQKGKKKNTYVQIGQINNFKFAKLQSLSKVSKINLSQAQSALLNDLEIHFPKYKTIQAYMASLAKTAKIFSQAELGDLLAHAKQNNNNIVLSKTQYHQLRKYKGYQGISNILQAPEIVSSSSFYLQKKRAQWYFVSDTGKSKQMNISNERISSSNATIHYSKKDLARLKKKRIMISTHLKSTPWIAIMISDCPENETQCDFMTLSETGDTILWADGSPDSLIQMQADTPILIPFQKKFTLAKKLITALTVLQQSDDYESLKTQLKRLSKITSYPIFRNNQYFIADKKGNYCQVETHKYQRCSQTFKNLNTQKIVSWKHTTSAVSYTQTVIHSDKYTAEYFFQVNDDSRFENTTLRAATLNLSRLKQRIFHSSGYKNIAWINPQGQYQKMKRAGRNTNINMAVWIDKDDVTLMTRPDHKGKIIHKRLQMRQRFYVLNNNYLIEYDDKKWSLLAHYHQKGPQNNTLVGWVAHEDLLLHNTPVISDTTGFRRKLLFREGDVTRNSQANEVTIYHNSKLTGTSEKFSVKSVYYVYKYYPETEILENANRLFISPTRYLHPNKNKEELIAGWIDRDKVTFWDTRSGIELKQRRKYKLKLENGDILRFSLKYPFQHDELRFPILKSYENSYKIAIFGKRIHIANNQSYQHYWEGTISKKGTKERLLMARSDLEELLPHLIAMLRLSDDVEEREKVWNEFLTVLTRDSSCEEIDTGKALTATECNKRSRGIPIHAGFMEYTREEFVGLGPNDMNQVICEARVLRSIIRGIDAEKKVVSTEWRDKENCEFELETTRDINGDGKVVAKGKGTTRYPEDSYFYSDVGATTEVMWLPADALRVDY